MVIESGILLLLPPTLDVRALLCGADGSKVDTPDVVHICGKSTISEPVGAADIANRIDD